MLAEIKMKNNKEQKIESATCAPVRCVMHCIFLSEKNLCLIHNKSQQSKLFFSGEHRIGKNSTWRKRQGISFFLLRFSSYIFLRFFYIFLYFPGELDIFPFHKALTFSFFLFFSRKVSISLALSLFDLKHSPSCAFTDAFFIIHCH